MANKRPPDRIWLQWYDEGDDEFLEAIDYPGEGATWCSDQINDSDVEYMRSDKAAAPKMAAALRAFLAAEAANREVAWPTNPVDADHFGEHVANLYDEARKMAKQALASAEEEE